MLNYFFTQTPLAFFTQNLWRDEAYSYLLAKKSIVEIVQLTAGDFSPPLYYIVLNVWIRIFSSSEVMLRSLSLVFYAATLYVLFEILNEVFKLSRIKSFLYLGLFILNPFLTYYAFEARMYMMVTFFITLAYFAFWTKKKKLYVISMALALYTHYFAIFILVAHLLELLFRQYHIALNLKQFKLNIAHIKRGFSLREPIIVVLTLVPWIIFVLFNHDFSDNSFWIVKPPIKDLWYTPFVLFTGYERVFGEYYHEQAGYTGFHADILKLLYGILIFPLLLYFYSTVKTKRKHKLDFSLKYVMKKTKDILGFFEERTLLTSLLIWAFFTPYVLFFLSYVIQPYYLPRYFIFASVGFILLLIYAFEHMINVKKPSIATFTGIVLLGLLVIIMGRFNKANLEYRSKRDVSALSYEIQMLMDEDDYAYVTSVLDYHLYKYYLGSNNVRIYGQSYADIPQYVGKVLIPEDAVTTQFPVYPSRAFVIYYDSYTTKSLY